MEKRIKIVFVTRQFVDISIGGLENHVVHLARALVAFDCDVTIIRISSLPSMIKVNDVFKFLVVPISNIRPQALDDVGRSSKFGELLSRLLCNFYSRDAYEVLLHEIEGADIIHFHDFLAIIKVSKQLSRNNQVYWTNHLGEFLKITKMPFGKIFLRWSTRQFSAAIGPSLELAEAKAIGTRVWHIPNGVDLKNFGFLSKTERIELRKEMDFPIDKKIVLVPRRWAPNKGVRNLTFGLRDLEYPNLHFIFVGAGTGSYANYKKEIVDDLRQWKTTFTILDSISPDNMPKYYQISDFTLLPSIEEAVSLSALEAMACGSIVLATPLGGFLELIRHTINGILSSDTTPEALIRLVNHALQLNEVQILEMEQEARRTVSENYTWQAIAMQTKALYIESANNKNE